MANRKQTSSTVASTASKILKDNRYSDSAKSAAGVGLNLFISINPSIKT